jgi:predicted transcriptional regulator
MPANITNTRTLLQTRFGQIWPVHVEGFTRLLILLRQQFDGDLDMLLVIAVIGEATLPKHLLPANFSYGELLQVKGQQVNKTDINTQSIAAYSGIPRETVRRKLERLADKGWIERNDNGGWTATRKGSQDLQEATDATIDYLAAIGDAIGEAGAAAKA